MVKKERNVLLIALVLSLSAQIALVLSFVSKSNEAPNLMKPVAETKDLTK